MKKVKLQYLFLLLLAPLLGSCETDEVNQIEVDPATIVTEEQEVLALELEQYTYYHNGEALTDATEIIDLMSDAYSINHDGDKVQIYSSEKKSPINFSVLEEERNIKPSSEEPTTAEEAKTLANETNARVGQSKVLFYTLNNEWNGWLRKTVRHMWHSNGSGAHYYGWRNTVSSDLRTRSVNIKNIGSDTFVFNSYRSRRTVYLRVGIYVRPPVSYSGPSWFYKEQYHSYTVYPNSPVKLRYTKQGNRLGGYSQYRNYKWSTIPNLHYAAR